ncbi:hypothetical protein C7M84_010361 [Penaeus vannamei]|uniref:Uncharacterized protein n=1 Tax=Penaeus vannamei TaxID=6689 RepID=A0A3R7Q8K0_PENVA|nr:hypothetical protein C7M84_010361 [Penaeus vannamei]
MRVRNFSLSLSFLPFVLCLSFFFAFHPISLSSSHHLNHLSLPRIFSFFFLFSSLFSTPSLSILSLFSPLYLSIYLSISLSLSLFQLSILLPPLSSNLNRSSSSSLLSLLTSPLTHGLPYPHLLLPSLSGSLLFFSSYQPSSPSLSAYLSNSSFIPYSFTISLPFHSLRALFSTHSLPTPSSIPFSLSFINPSFSFTLSSSAPSALPRLSTLPLPSTLSSFFFTPSFINHFTSPFHSSPFLTPRLSPFPLLPTLVLFLLTPFVYQPSLSFHSIPALSSSLLTPRLSTTLPSPSTSVGVSLLFPSHCQFVLSTAFHLLPTLSAGSLFLPSSLPSFYDNAFPLPSHSVRLSPLSFSSARLSTRVLDALPSTPLRLTALSLPLRPLSTRFLSFPLYYPALCLFHSISFITLFRSPSTLSSFTSHSLVIQPFPCFSRPHSSSSALPSFINASPSFLPLCSTLRLLHSPQFYQTRALPSPSTPHHSFPFSLHRLSTLPLLLRSLTLSFPMSLVYQPFFSFHSLPLSFSLPRLSTFFSPSTHLALSLLTPHFYQPSSPSTLSLSILTPRLINPSLLSLLLFPSSHLLSFSSHSLVYQPFPLLPLSPLLLTPLVYQPFSSPILSPLSFITPSLFNPYPLLPLSPLSSHSPTPSFINPSLSFHSIRLSPLSFSLPRLSTLLSPSTLSSFLPLPRLSTLPSPSTLPSFPSHSLVINPFPLLPLSTLSSPSHSLVYQPFPLLPLSLPLFPSHSLVYFNPSSPSTLSSSFSLSSFINPSLSFHSLLFLLNSLVYQPFPLLHSLLFPSHSLVYQPFPLLPFSPLPFSLPRLSTFLSFHSLLLSHSLLYQPFSLSLHSLLFLLTPSLSTLPFSLPLSPLSFSLPRLSTLLSPSTLSGSLLFPSHSLVYQPFLSFHSLLFPSHSLVYQPFPLLPLSSSSLLTPSLSTLLSPSTLSSFLLTPSFINPSLSFHSLLLLPLPRLSPFPLLPLSPLPSHSLFINPLSPFHSLRPLPLSFSTPSFITLLSPSTLSSFPSDSLVYQPSSPSTLSSSLLTPSFINPSLSFHSLRLSPLPFHSLVYQPFPSSSTLSSFLPTPSFINPSLSFHSLGSLLFPSHSLVYQPFPLLPLYPALSSSHSLVYQPFPLLPLSPLSFSLPPLSTLLSPSTLLFPSPHSLVYQPFLSFHSPLFLLLPRLSTLPSPSTLSGSLLFLLTPRLSPSLSFHSIRLSPLLFSLPPLSTLLSPSTLSGSLLFPSHSLVYQPFPLLPLSPLSFPLPRLSTLPSPSTLSGSLLFPSHSLVYQPFPLLPLYPAESRRNVPKRDRQCDPEISTGLWLSTLKCAAAASLEVVWLKGDKEPLAPSLLQPHAICPPPPPHTLRTPTNLRSNAPPSLFYTPFPILPYPSPSLDPLVTSANPASPPLPPLTLCQPPSGWQPHSATPVLTATHLFIPPSCHQSTIPNDILLPAPCHHYIYYHIPY